jgi:hypothetical protein
MSVATTGATGPIKFRIQIYEREEQSANKTLNYRPNDKYIKHDPHDYGSSMGPNLIPIKQRFIDNYSTDAKNDTQVTFIRLQTVIVNPETTELVKFKVRSKKKLNKKLLQS